MTVKLTVSVVASFWLLISGHSANSQQIADALNHISHSSSAHLVERDGTCIDAPISKVDANTITFQPYGKPPVVIARANVLQISQGDTLLFTALNSWSNVQQAATHFYPGEAFVLKMRSGKLVKGRPTTVTSNSISLKHGLETTQYRKDEVETIDYLRLKPESDQFDYFSQEAPALLFFSPEFYYRAMGLEGRIPVRLYDESRPITNTIPVCSRR